MSLVLNQNNNCFDMSGGMIDVLSTMPHEHNFNISDTMRLAHTCKALYNVLTKHWNTRKIGPYTLKLQQYIFDAKIHENFKKFDTVFLSSLMGSGKTLTAIYYIKEFFLKNCLNRENVLIVSPPGCIKIWITELTKVGMLSAKPMESQVLVYHSTRPNHQALHKNGSTDMFLYHRIVLTTDAIADKIQGSVGLVIRDECHKPMKSSLRNFNTRNEPKMLGLTANDITPSFDYRILKLKDVDFKDKIPNINYHYHNIDNGKNDSYCKYKFHIQDVVEYEDSYRAELIKCIKPRKKVVIFTDKGEIGTMVRKWIMEHLWDYKLFEVKTSNATIKNFHDYNAKSILFILLSSNEGLNVFEEHMIIVKPDIIATDRIIQSIGRLQRPMNPYPNVTCSFIVGGKIALLKSFYAACYSVSSWEFGYDASPGESFLLKCAGIIGLLGFPVVTDFPRIDGCVIFDAVHTRERYEAVSKWWLANKTDESVLTLEHINALYI